MEDLAEAYDTSIQWLPILVTIIVSGVVLVFTDKVIRRRASKLGRQNNFSRQITLIVLTAIAVASLILSLPIKEGMKDQLFGLLGLAITAIIALSSTTFVSNAMAGLMSRSVGSFWAGDFIRVNEHFGRVTERGLFHTEIQTADRDLMTIPNLYLVTHPVSVVRRSGTVISATVSLGYDLDHEEVEPLLLNAAKRAELEDPFVQVMELGDFSVSYRVAGFLKEVTRLVSCRSRLNVQVLDTLHQAGIEIVSPSVMAQRPLADDVRLLPESDGGTLYRSTRRREQLPEERIFDKAERAAERERLQAERAQLAQEIDEQKKAHGIEDLDKETDLPSGLAQRGIRIQAIDKKLELMSKDLDKS